MKKYTRDDTEHGQGYYLASDVDALLAQAVQGPHEEWPGQSNIESPHNACQHLGYCKQLKAQLVQPVQVQWLQSVTKKIEAALLSHRLSLHKTAEDDGLGFLLADALCCGQKSLEFGKREVEDIVEAIYHVLNANTPPTPAAQPANKPESVSILIYGDAYEVPMPVACEMLWLNLLLLQPVQEPKWAMPQGWWIVESTPEALNMWPTSANILLDEALAQPSLPVQPVQRKPLTYEQNIALRKGHQIGASEDYFAARPCSHDLLRVFEYAFYRGWETARCAIPEIGQLLGNPKQLERKPLTDEQAMDLLPTNTSMSRTALLLWVLRATERAHGITDPMASGDKVMGGEA